MSALKRFILQAKDVLEFKKSSLLLKRTEVENLVEDIARLDEVLKAKNNTIHNLQTELRRLKAEQNNNKNETIVINWSGGKFK